MPPSSTEYEPPYCASANMQLATKLPRPIIQIELVIENWHRAQGRRTVGRAWRRVGPRWQVDLQHPRKPSGAGVLGCRC